MRTTIELPDSVFQQAKLTALQRGQTLKELFTQALVSELAEKPPPIRRMSAPPIGRSGDHFIPARTNAEIASILNGEDQSK